MTDQRPSRLGRKRLFHGSSVSFQPGDVLHSARWLGLPELAKTVHQQRYDPGFVYVTERPDYAAAFGTVYEVQPLGPVTRDPDAPFAWRCRRAKVVARGSSTLGGAA